jgi:hypothetical protein
VEFKRDLYDYWFKAAVVLCFLEGCPPGTFPRDGRMEEYLLRVFPHHCGNAQARESKRKFVYSWVKIAGETIRRAATASGGGKKKARPLGAATILGPETEERIVEWIYDLRRDCVPISSIMFREKVLEIAIEMGVDGRLKAKHENESCALVLWRDDGLYMRRRSPEGLVLADVHVKSGRRDAGTGCR